MIRLASGDGHVFDVDLDVARSSGTIDIMLEELDIEENGILPIPGVKGKVLKKAIDYAVYHKNEPPPERDATGFPLDKRTDLCEWDLKFFNHGQPVNDVYELLLASQYLDMKGLFDASCKMVANLIKGKSPEEIRRTFNIKNDLELSDFKHGVMPYKLLGIKHVPKDVRANLAKSSHAKNDVKNRKVNQKSSHVKK